MLRTQALFINFCVAWDNAPTPEYDLYTFSVWLLEIPLQINFYVKTLNHFIFYLRKNKIQRTIAGVQLLEI